MPKPINYMLKPLPTPENGQELIPLAREIAGMFASAETYQRSGPIFIRKVTPNDAGTTLVTWVKDPVTGNPRVEGDGVVLKEGMFILRNPDPISITETAYGVESIFNEYVCNDIAYMTKHYGQAVLDSLTGEFQLKRKKGQFQAIRITEELFNKFAANGCVDMDEQGHQRIHVAVDFSPFVMYAYQGGWLNSNGYAIGEVEMSQNYEPVLQEPFVPKFSQAQAIAQQSPLFGAEAKAQTTAKVADQQAGARVIF